MKPKVFALALVVLLTIVAVMPVAAIPLFGPCAPGAAYDPACDANQDGHINITDIQLAAGHWNQTGTFTSDNNHIHLGQTWTGNNNPLVISGTFNQAPDYAGLVGSNLDGNGITGRSASDTASGVYGENTAGGYGVAGRTSGTYQTAGVYGVSTSTFGGNYGVYGQINDYAGYGVYGNNDSNFAGYGVFGNGATGVAGYSPIANGYGVQGTATGTGEGVRGQNFASGNGVDGYSVSAHGVLAASAGAGINGSALYAHAEANNGIAIVAEAGSSSDSAVVIGNSGSGNFVVGLNGGNPQFRVNTAGRGYFNGGTQTGGADVAEFIPAPANLEPGDVIEIDPEHAGSFRLAATPGSTAVAGVISTEPGVSLGGASAAGPESDGPQLALVGRVPVKVTAQGGPIQPGDLLVASSLPGHAMRSPANPAPGTVIGKALEPLASGTGVIQMLVMLR